MLYILYKIYNQDCLAGMKDLPDDSIDLILCDLPYQRTKNRWDVIIPFAPLWEQYKRLIKPNGAILLFADGMFMADLMKSNEPWWRYNLVWDKQLTSGFLNANRQPLRQHEQICVFYQKQPTYNPQKTIGEKSHSKGKAKDCENNNYGEYRFVDNADAHGNMKFPTSILSFQKPHPSSSLHPTEKSVALCEWLIRTYSNPGDVVLDNCMGCGTTGIAALNTGRRFIGYETDEQYFTVAQERLFSHNSNSI